MIENNSLIVVVFNTCRAGTGHPVVEEYVVGCTVGAVMETGCAQRSSNWSFPCPLSSVFCSIRVAVMQHF